MEASKSWLPILLLVVYTDWNLTYTTRQGSQVSCLTQTGFAAFGKGVQLISGFLYAETDWRENWWAKQLARLPCLVVNVKFQFVYTIKISILHTKKHNLSGARWYVWMTDFQHRSNGAWCKDTMLWMSCRPNRSAIWHTDEGKQRHRQTTRFGEQACILYSYWVQTNVL